MSFEPRDYLRHIEAEADFLISQSRNLTRAEFDGSPTLQRAFVRSIEIIGEAAKKLPREFRDAHPELEWRAMAGMLIILFTVTSPWITRSFGMS